VFIEFVTTDKETAKAENTNPAEYSDDDRKELLRISINDKYGRTPFASLSFINA
jgi:hypothetical protein